MHEDIVVRVNLDDKYRFLVVTKKGSTIKDLKSDICKVARLVLSSDDIREIISVQNTHEFELPEIYTVGRLLKEHDKVLAYTNSYEPTSKTIDSTNKEYLLSDVSQSCLPRRNEEETNNSSPESIQHVVEPVTSQDVKEGCHHNKGSSLNNGVECVRDILEQSNGGHSIPTKPSKTKKQRGIESEAGNIECEEGAAEFIHHTSVISNSQKQNEEHVHLRESFTKENIEHINTPEKSEVFEISLPLKRHIIQNQSKPKRRKESRTKSIDDSLAEEEFRNRPSDDTSNVSLQSSSISEAVFKSPCFQAILQSKQFRYPRRRQAIEKSVTKVANWLVGSEDNPTKKQTNQTESEINKSSGDAEQEEQVKMYCLVDIREDKVIYYDSDPSEASHSGGQLKESNLLSCTLALSSNSVSIHRRKRKCGEMNEDGITENELPATCKPPIFHKNLDHHTSKRLHNDEKDEIEDDKSSTEILDHDDDIDRASSKKPSHATKSCSKPVNTSPQQTEIHNTHDSSNALNDIVQNQSKSSEDFQEPSKGPIATSTQVNHAQTVQESNTANIALREQSNENVPHDTTRNEYVSDSSSESTGEKHELNKSDKNTEQNRSVSLPNKQTAESDSDSDTSSKSIKEKEKLTQSVQIPVPNRLTSLPSKQAAGCENDSNSSLESAKEKEKLTQLDKVHLPNLSTSVSNKKPDKSDSDSDSSSESADEKKNLTQPDTNPVNNVTKQATISSNTIAKKSESDSSLESAEEKQNLTQHDNVANQSTGVLNNAKPKESDSESDSSLESAEEKQKLTQHDKTLAKKLDFDSIQISDNEHINQSKTKNTQNKVLTVKQGNKSKTLSTAANDESSQSDSDYLHTTDSEDENNKAKTKNAETKTTKQGNKSKVFSKKATKGASKHSDSSYSDSEDENKDLPKLASTVENKKERKAQPSAKKNGRNASHANLNSPNKADSVKTKDAAKSLKKDIQRNTSSTATKKVIKSKTLPTKSCLDSSSLSDSEYLHTTDSEQEKEVRKDKQKSTIAASKSQEEKPKNLPKNTAKTVSKSDSDSSSSEGEQNKKSGKDVAKATTSSVGKQGSLTQKLPNKPSGKSTMSDSSTSDSEQEDKFEAPSEKAVKVSKEKLVVNVNSLCNSPLKNGKKDNNGNKCDATGNVEMTKSNTSISETTKDFSQRKANKTPVLHTTQELQHEQSSKNSLTEKSNILTEETEVAVNQRQGTENVHTPSKKRPHRHWWEDTETNVGKDQEDSEPKPPKKKKMNSKDSDNDRGKETTEVENIKKRKKANKAKDGSLEVQTSVVEKTSVEEEKLEQTHKKKQRKRKNTEVDNSEAHTNEGINTETEDKNSEQTNKSPKKGKKAKDGHLQTPTNTTMCEEQLEKVEQTSKSPKKGKKAKDGHLQTPTITTMCEEQLEKVERTSKSPQKGKKAKDGSEESDNVKEKSKKKKKKRKKRSSSQENTDNDKDGKKKEEKVESNSTEKEIINTTCSLLEKSSEDAVQINISNTKDLKKKKKKKKDTQETTEEKQFPMNHPNILENKKSTSSNEGKSKRQNNQCNGDITHDTTMDISTAEHTAGQEDESKSRKKKHKKKKHKERLSESLESHDPKDKVDGFADESIVTNTEKLPSQSPSLKQKHEKMFSSGSEDDTKHKEINSLLSWIEKKTASPQNKTLKRTKSKLLDLAQDEDDNVKTSNTNTATPSSRSSRSFHRTPTGFTNTLPRMKKTSSRLFFPFTSTRRKRKLSHSISHPRELTPKEKEILLGGVNQLDTLLNEDSFWNT